MLKENHTEKKSEKAWILLKIVLHVLFSIIGSFFVLVKVLKFAEHVNLVVENMKKNTKNIAKMRNI